MMSSLLLLVLTFVSLNTENLFDTIDDPATQDDAFTPTGLYVWTPVRYWQKLNNIGQAILSCGERDDGSVALPDLVALQEVENDSVLTALTRHTLLRGAGYDYLTTHSPDTRGTNVALLYSPLTFAPITSYALRVTPLRGMRPTRDILYVKGRTAHDDTLHIFVVHAPSRLGGEYATRPHRQQVVARLTLSLDSLRALSPQAHIIIAGDFNDPPQSSTLLPLSARAFTDLAATAHGTYGAQGSYKYREVWETIDHIFVSASLAGDAQCYINDMGTLLTRDDDYGGQRPNRTYYRLRWRNAYSDHLPVVAVLHLPAATH